MEKVIFWDFDGTLVHANQRFVDAFMFALQKFGYQMDREKATEILKSVYPWLNYDRAYPNETHLWWDNFLYSLGDFYIANNVRKEDYVKINNAFRERITKVNDYVLFDDTKKVLQECINRGYKNYILSNNFPELTDFVSLLGLTDYFSAIIVSSRVGYEKPRKELFDYAKKIANCTSGIMVGDNPNADIIGGKNAGLKTVFVHNESPSEADYSFNTLEEIIKLL